MTLAQMKRRLAGMTQKERMAVAAKAGLGFGIVQRMAIGKNHSPRLCNFIALQKVLRRENR